MVALQLGNRVLSSATALAQRTAVVRLLAFSQLS